jgi:hypothetical protein
MPRGTNNNQERVFAELSRLAHSAGSGEVSVVAHVAGRARLVEAVAKERPGSVAKGRWAAVVAMAAAVAIGVGAVAIRQTTPLAFSVEGASTTEGGFVIAPPASEATLRFADGSDVRLTPGSSARVVSGKARHLVIERGHAAVHVAPHASLSWLLDVGPFALQVEGASLDVDWSGNDLNVAAREGSAIVRGPLAPNGVTVTAGQHLIAHVREGELRLEPAGTIAAIGAGMPSAIPSEPLAPEAGAPEGAAGDDLEVLPLAPGAGAAPAHGGKHAGSWSARVSAGDYASVVKDAESAGIDGALQQRPLADLVALADASRYTNRGDLSRRALLAERSRFPGSKEARTAAFLLGRIADDQDHAPNAAVDWYDRYLKEAPGGPFASEALGRKMIAVSKVSGRGAARPLAEEYARRYPRGSYASVARELLTP